MFVCISVCTFVFIYIYYLYIIYLFCFFPTGYVICLIATNKRVAVVTACLAKSKCKAYLIHKE